MAIDPNAILHFLERKGRLLPDYKRMEPPELERRIKSLTGHYPELITPPRLPQLQGLAMALNVERALLFYFMRMGKSFIALNWASHLALSGLWETGKGLIVVPRPILLDVWASEARRHSVLKVVTCGPDMGGFVDAIDSNADLIVVAATSLQAMLTYKNTPKRKKNGKQQPPRLYPDYDTIEALAPFFSMVIIDEIHGFKNHLGLRFGIMAGLVKHCRFRLGLTGSAWGRNPFDVWAQAFLIDEGDALGKNFFFFEAAFGIKEHNFAIDRKVYQFDKSKMPILQDKLASFSISYKREDIVNQVVEGLVELSLHGDQREAYVDTINKLIKLPSGARHEIKNTFIRLRQVASGFLPFTDEEGEERVVCFQQNSKIEWLQEFLSELEPDVKIIIFYVFTASGRRICEECAKAKLRHVWLWSGTPDKPAAVRAFQHGSADVIVVNAQSGDVGIDLSAADYKLFYESPISTTIRVQAEQRAQGDARNGRSLLIDDMVSAPVEARVLALVKEGKDIMSELFKDPKRFAEQLKLPLAGK